jgi:hypothetical protein
MSGEISGIEITQGFLLAIVYIVSIVAAAIGEDANYLFLSAVEIAMLLLIVGYAWTWPRQSS